jgi:hypothetical protein
MNLLITSPRRISPRFKTGRGEMAIDDILHLTYLELALREHPESGEEFKDYTVVALSFRLASLSFWGPRTICLGIAAKCYSVDKAIRDTMLHYGIAILGGRDLNEAAKLAVGQKAVFLPSLPYDDWRTICRLLDEARHQRVMNRIKCPRRSRKEVFPNDVLDIALSRWSTRVNAILNDQLYWGKPDNIYLPLNTQ